MMRMLDLALAIVVAATLDANLARRLTDYKAHLAVAEQGAGSLELAYREGLGIAKSLLEVHDHETVLESLDARARALVDADLKGFTVNTEEVVFAAPVPNFFLGLAKKRHDAASIAFFALLKQYKPEGVWPAYIRVQVDYGGCTEFGSMRLTNLYAAQRAYQAKFPKNYLREAKEIADAVENDLTNGTCACGDKASVEKEFTAFLAKFPKEPVSVLVEKRLTEVRAGKTAIRFTCTAG